MLLLLRRVRHLLLLLLVLEWLLGWLVHLHRGREPLRGLLEVRLARDVLVRLRVLWAGRPEEHVAFNLLHRQRTRL